MSTCLTMKTKTLSKAHSYFLIRFAIISYFALLLFIYFETDSFKNDISTETEYTLDFFHRNSASVFLGSLVINTMIDCVTNRPEFFQLIIIFFHKLLSSLLSSNLVSFSELKPLFNTEPIIAIRISSFKSFIKLCFYFSTSLLRLHLLDPLL